MWKDPGEFEKFLNDKGKNGWKLVKERDLGGVWTMIFQKEIEG